MQKRNETALTFSHLPGHDTSRTSRVVGGSDFPDRTYYRDTLVCDKCGWQGEDFGDDQKLLLSHLIHALSEVLS